MLVFLGTNEHGLPSEPIRGDDGRYRITGSLTSATAPFFRRALKICQPLSKEVAKTGVILVAPTPCYISGKCCNDPRHIENSNDKDFEESVVAGVEMAKSILDTWGTELGLNYVLIDPMLIANPGDLELRRRKRSAGAPLWCKRDHVHLTIDGYKDIADTILDYSFEQIGSEHLSLTGASTSSSGARSKRKMVEPVVTMPKERLKAKRCKLQPAQAAGWLLGIHAEPNDGIQGSPRGGRGGRAYGSGWRMGGAWRGRWSRQARWQGWW